MLRQQCQVIKEAHIIETQFKDGLRRWARRLDRVSVPSPIAIDILMDTMAEGFNLRDRAHMYLFSV